MNVEVAAEMTRRDTDVASVESRGRIVEGQGGRSQRGLRACCCNEDVISSAYVSLRLGDTSDGWDESPFCVVFILG